MVRFDECDSYLRIRDHYRRIKRECVNPFRVHFEDEFDEAGSGS